MATKEHREKHLSLVHCKRMVNVMQRGNMKDIYALWAFAIPIFSTRSSVCRRPAVSDTRTGRPAMSNVVSRTSRVVPGREVTIAASRCASEKVRWIRVLGPGMKEKDLNRRRSPIQHTQVIE